MDSITNQSLRDIEIICIDDGSTDGSGRILEQNALVDARIHIEKQNNMGQSVARNRALSQARGKYIAFVDADDYIEEHWLEMLYREAERSGADVVMGPSRVVNQNDMPLHLDSFAALGELSSYAAKLDSLPHGGAWNKLYRSAFLNERRIRFPERLYWEDNLFSIKVCYYANLFLPVEEGSCYNYMVNTGSTTQHPAHRERLQRDAWQIVEQVAAFMREVDCTPEEREKTLQFCLKHFLDPHREILAKEEHYQRLLDLFGPQPTLLAARAQQLKQREQVCLAAAPPPAPLRVAYVDLWADREPAETCFEEWAREKGAIIDSHHPDILFYACGGVSHVRQPALVKVCWVQENVFPNFNVCDYAISHMRDSICGRNLYFPYYCEALRERIEPPPVTPADARRPFGVFIASQDHMGPGAEYRKEFVARLSMAYKHVDCPGKVLHNVGIPELGDRFAPEWNEQKRRVISRYKFLISFENSNADGYITEKLVDAFAANVVPIYWGSEGNLEPFPKNSLICANDYPDFDSLLARIREVDEDDELYLAMLRANPLRHHRIWEIVGDFHKRRRAFLDKIYQDAHTYKWQTINRPGRGMTEFDFAGRVCSCTHGCRELHYRSTPFTDWWKGLLRLHFLRPNKQRKPLNCPYQNLFNYRSRPGATSCGNECAD